MGTALQTIAIEQADTSGTRFLPPVPNFIEDTGINNVLLDDLIIKLLLNRSELSGRQIAEEICLPFKILECALRSLKNQMLIGMRSVAGLNDFTYFLTQEGLNKAIMAREANAYVGAAPVPFKEYLESVLQQTISNESPSYENLKEAFKDLILEPSIFEQLGPALNSGRAVLFYGAPGNGKTSVAKRIYHCFRQNIYIPKTLLVEGCLIKLFDSQCHELADQDGQPIPFDQRWVRIKRPSVIVGGEMDLASVEINYNPLTKLCEAPMQLKANGGIFVVDDFGRQRMKPEELMNRWILPLEKRIDFLTLPNGIKVQTPFDELIIFCSNINPQGLLEEAFLRRIPHRIKFPDPTHKQFKQIMTLLASQYGIGCDNNDLNYILERYFNGRRPLRRCHPRDILDRILNASAYQRTKPLMSRTLVDFACMNYFNETESVK